MKVWFALIIACVLSGSASLSMAQTPDKQKRSDAILMKARQLDLLNHLLPLTLTKAQINALLIPIEKSRSNVKKIQALEMDDLAKYDERITQGVEAGVNNAKVPSLDLLKEVNKLFMAFTVRRQIAAGENADLVYEVIKKEFNKGQIAVAANTIDPKAYDPSADPKTWTEEMKIKLFIKDVLLDPQAYDLLVRMAKRAP